MIQVYTKKKYRFFPPHIQMGSDILRRRPDGLEGNKELFVETKVNDISVLPDWAADETMFKWAKESGNLIVLQSPAQVLIPQSLPEVGETTSPVPPANSDADKGVPPSAAPAAAPSDQANAGEKKSASKK